MTAFATVSDLATYLQRDLTAADTATGQMFLDLASAGIRREIGMSLVSVINESISLDGHGRPDELLPEWPVQAVRSVAVTSYTGGIATVTTLAEHVDYEWSTAGVLGALSWKASGSAGATYDYSWGSRAMSTVPVWPKRPRCMAVSYDHGPDAAWQAVLQSVCLGAAARAMVNPTGDLKEAIGNYSVEHGQVSAVSLLVEGDVSALRELRGTKVR